MAEKHYQDLDLRQNKLQNVRIDPLQAFPTVPAPVNGQVIFREDLGVFYWYNSSATDWVPLGSTTLIAEAGSGLTATPQPDGSYEISFNPDEDFLEIDPTLNTVKIKDAAITAIQLADDAVTTDKIQDTNVTFAKIQDIPTMTLIGRTAAGSGVPASILLLDDGTFGSNSHTGIPTQASVKAYVDGSFGIFGVYEGEYNAATAGGLFPQRALGNVRGSAWSISVAGTLQGEVFQVGDVVMAKMASASPANINDWVRFQGNLPAASEAEVGYIAIASQAEVNLGADNTKAVTPATLFQRLLAGSGRFTTDIGDGESTEFTIGHGLGTDTVTVYLLDKATNTVCVTSVVIIGTTAVRLNFTTPPTELQYQVIIKTI